MRSVRANWTAMTAAKSGNGQTSPHRDQRLILAKSLGALVLAAVTVLSLRILDHEAEGAPAAAVTMLTDDLATQIPHWRVPAPQSIGVFVWQVPDSRVDALRGQPIALQLSGPFSAWVTWNDVRIGKKGRIGRTRSEETPGPIDARLPIPAGAIRPSDNRVIVHYSAHHLNYAPAAVIQDFSLTAYRGDPRRSLRYYGVLTASFAAMAGLGFGALQMARQRRDARPVWLATACLGFLIAGAAEVSRAFINYPYPWHAPRQAVVWLGFALALGALLAFVMARWPMGWRAALVTGFCACAGWIGGFVTQNGFDARIIVAAVATGVITFLWCARRALRLEIQPLVFGVLPVSLVAAALLSPGRFIDQHAAAITVFVLGYFCLVWPDVIAPARIVMETDTRIAIGGGRDLAFVDVGTVAFLKAAGNYTEIHMNDGAWKLDHRSLGGILAAHPGNFHRIHKSYAVAVDRVAQLESSRGSRYRVRLTNGEWLPVGRSRVTELRARLKTF